ncbi:type II toxin-antitoxin system prevent-host-death family antitoxin [Pseudonocardia sp. DSM 110487]|uniref:type II toxin-antitoxin system Phd/YefM family antitoxin n=1 Tax=Pseudonocardia sp. DSM 110487 TaxID=2865833 RepID=UPI001C6957CA|nr:type II toxin-antitoxin system prevent-host-death family antitoxin [Pseudonocardia sp. DSM 110487]QYN37972.1 type II toxin-antitoxin system prevent-host-death family antitoxin [Pseudonocardia sp. DSM 110487]
MTEQIGVADAKRRFSELADRVGNGESFLIVNRGRPVLALVPPQRLAEDEVRPVGLAAFAGALAGEWDTVEDDMEEIVSARQYVADRPPPDIS